MQALANHPSPPSSPTAPSPPDPTDEALLARFAASRDNEAFARIVGRHFDRVRATALRISPDPAAADDVSQAVFLLLARRASDLSRVRLWKRTGVVASFLHRATVLTALHLRRTESRRKKHEQAASQPDRLPTTTAPSTEIPDLDAAINALRTPERLAILYRYWEGLSVQQTAEKLGITSAAAAKRLTRALSRLRSRLGPTALAAPLTPLLVPVSDPTAEAALTQTLHTSLQPPTSPLPPIAAIAAQALQRWFLIQTARVSLSVFAVIAGMTVATATAAHLLGGASESAPAALAATVLPPQDLKDEALVEWLIARNEESIARFSRMSCDIRNTFVNAVGAEPQVRLDSWLIDEPRRKVDWTQVQVPTGMPGGKMIRKDHRSIQIITPEQFIECLPETQQTMIYRPDADGYYSKATVQRFNAADHPLRMLAGGTGTERLRSLYANRKPESRWTAARVERPGGRIAYAIITTWNFPNREVINQRYLDPELGYLMTDLELLEGRLLMMSQQTEFRVIDGVSVPTRITRTWHGDNGRGNTVELSNIKLDIRVAPEDFKFDSLPLPPLTTYGIMTHGRDAVEAFIREGKRHIPQDSPDYREAQQRYWEARTGLKPPGGKP